MEERYPFIRFAVDAAPFIAAAAGLVVFLSGTLSACQRGGIGGALGFVVVVILAAAAYVGIMVGVESLKLLINIEGNGRERLAETRRQARPERTN